MVPRKRLKGCLVEWLFGGYEKGAAKYTFLQSQRPAMQSDKLSGINSFYPYPHTQPVALVLDKIAVSPYPLFGDKTC